MEEMNGKKASGWRNNKWFRAAIPALLLHCSIGTVYCWSIFSQEIADYIGQTKGATEWAFSFAIFFLGMSAAFLGNVVEKDVHKSSLIGTICFAGGMAGTGYFIYYGGLHKGSPLALIGIYVCYGFIMGIGLGTGYLSPVKTLMLWFQDHKGSQGACHGSCGCRLWSGKGDCQPYHADAFKQSGRGRHLQDVPDSGGGLFLYDVYWTSSFEKARRLA